MLSSKSRTKGATNNCFFVVKETGVHQSEEVASLQNERIATVYSVFGVRPSIV